ncbi:MAG: recombinase family protein [Acidobacteriota bacterium]
MNTRRQPSPVQPCHRSPGLPTFYGSRRPREALPSCAAIYGRVSSDTQTVDNQLLEFRAYVTARQWTRTGEHRDECVSGSTDRRPALDRLMSEARRGRVDVVPVWSLDRFGRPLAHVVTAVQELHERGVAFVSLKEGLDLSTAAGRLQLHILSARGEFERARLIERTKAGLRGRAGRGRGSGAGPSA